MVLLLSLVISRYLAFPSTIWDQDEANFALAVLHFDPLHNQPHAPFFPLWIVLGKIVRSLLPGIELSTALQIVSVTASVWIFFPLRSLWNLMLSRGEATLAAALYLFMPAPWLLSGRAYSEPMATAFFIAGIALWLRPSASRRDLVGGGLLLAASILVRPQWILLALPISIWRVIRSRGLIDRLLIILPPAVLGLGSGAALFSIAGGIGPLLAAIEQHRKYIVQAGSGFSWTFPELALNRALGGVIPGMVWMILTIGGIYLLIRMGTTGRVAGVLVGLVLAPQVLQLLLAQNPTLPRYALPVLALSSGLVVAGLRGVVRKNQRVFISVGAGILAAWISVVPSLARYRRPSPVMEAFSFLENNDNGGVAACDRRLVAFVTLLGRTGQLKSSIVWDYQIELGLTTRPFRPETRAIFTGADRDWVAERARVTRFSCDNPLLRKVASPRFLDLTVVRGCSLVRPANPSIKPEQLRPGAVIPVGAYPE